MADEQDQAETLDDDALLVDEVGDRELGDFPPDKPPGAQAYGAAGAEPHATEGVIAREAREDPEEQPLERPATASDVLDDEDDRSDDEDDRSDDESVVANARFDDRAAEDAAMHVVDESLGGFDSEVDDPDLAAANELDPEVHLGDR